ncbi:HAMP domain-containing protein [Bacillus lacus]|uniref:histidine kinase n=1 Tax=Metabacillus lacus TaxID=1983721 RepID=A0A7X2J1Y4_9BACI|nr:sensor histidine kinase [Metabacillus lacus]MRX73885.1 HAMP domain-containing protein [Metabacillus lacus]
MLKTSIRNKLIVLLLLITIIPFGSSIVITYFYTKDSLQEQVVQENVNLLYQGKVNLRGYMDELNGLSLSLYNNPQFLNLLISSDRSDPYMTIGAVKNVLHTILYTEENLTRVNLTMVKDQKVISVSKRSAIVYAADSNLMNEAAFQKAMNSPENLFIEPMEGENTIALHRAILKVPSSEVLGFVTLEFREDRINQLGENLYSNQNEEFFILSPEGRTIYSSTGEETEGREWAKGVLESSGSQGTLEWNDGDFQGLMIFDRLPDVSGGWTMVKRIPYSVLYESAFQVAKINIFFGLIGLLLVVLSTLFVSFKITSPISVLLKNIEEVEKGNMNVKLGNLGNDEIGILGRRFEEMMMKINHHIDREYKLEIENKTNQLKALQSQLNPHFLYNALQSIGTIALKNKVPQIYSLITHLSSIMRYSMNVEEDMVPLRKEISYIQAFLLLQKERFGDKLQYDISADQETMALLVPKMLLQPIVENYFKHGFDSGSETGKLILTCKIEGAYLVMKVQDNGTGIEEQRMADIYDSWIEQKRSSEGSAHIGLKNISSRLQLYYGKKASLELENAAGGGLLVTLKIPADMGGVESESNDSGR